MCPNVHSFFSDRSKLKFILMGELFIDDGRKINRFGATFFSTFIRSNALNVSYKLHSIQSTHIIHSPSFHIFLLYFYHLLILSVQVLMPGSERNNTISVTDIEEPVYQIKQLT